MPRLDHQPFLFENLTGRILMAESVSAVIADIRSTYDLAHVTYHLVHNFADGPDSPYVRTTYPLEWVGEYVIRQFVDKDPVVRAGINRLAPFDWNSVSGEPHYNEIMNAAGAYVIGRQGYSCQSAPNIDPFYLSNFHPHML